MGILVVTCLEQDALLLELYLQRGFLRRATAKVLCIRFSLLVYDGLIGMRKAGMNSTSLVFVNMMSSSFLSQPIMR